MSDVEEEYDPEINEGSGEEDLEKTELAVDDVSSGGEEEEEAAAILEENLFHDESEEEDGGPVISLFDIVKGVEKKPVLTTRVAEAQYRSYVEHANLLDKENREAAAILEENLSHDESEGEDGGPAISLFDIVKGVEKKPVLTTQVAVPMKPPPPPDPQQQLILAYQTAEAQYRFYAEQANLLDKKYREALALHDPSAPTMAGQLQAIITHAGALYKYMQEVQQQYHAPVYVAPVAQPIIPPITAPSVAPITTLVTKPKTVTNPRELVVLQPGETDSQYALRLAIVDALDNAHWHAMDVEYADLTPESIAQTAQLIYNRFYLGTNYGPEIEEYLEQVIEIAPDLPPM